MFDLTGKTALVTGSTQGIGRAVADVFLKSGASVWIHGSRDAEKAKKTAEALDSPLWCVCDLSERDAAAALYEKTGDVDILVCNASVQYRTKWYEIGDPELETQLQVNFRSTLALMQRYSASMREKGKGRILTVGSVQQYRPHADMAVYAATKCAVMSLVRNIAKQEAPYGITVNNISPGVIDTPRNAGALADAAYSKKVLAGIPCGYVGSSYDIACAALFLCSDEGRYVTGTDITVDGGMAL